MKKIKRTVLLIIIAAVSLGILAVSGIQAGIFLFDGLKNQSLTEIEVSNLISSEIKIEEADKHKNCIINQSLLLVNAEHPLPDNFEAELVQYEDSDEYINSCLLEDFILLREAVTDSYDTRLRIMSAYRSKEKQLEIYEDDTEGVAAKPGESEHETGLGLDVYVKYFAGSGFLKSEAGQYVNKNCSDFGFIIRYPAGKKKITGFSHEPWHIRYVGQPHAKIISESNITLEEYIESLEVGKFYSYNEYIISRQESDKLTVPKNYKELVISPDNCGNYIITAKIN